LNLPEKVNAVKIVFESLDREIAQFQSASSLHCKTGCGRCCLKPDIEATVLEFLPFAADLHAKGNAHEWLEKLESSESAICLILNPTQAGAGLCSQYAHRGLICRLFGYSARTNKYGHNELITCQIIKTEQTAAFEEAEKQIEAGRAVPVMSDFYMRLHSIDADLARDFFPINEAIQRAIEVVLQYYAYREEGEL
jgi:Fe-S-cluster containining protein